MKIQEITLPYTNHFVEGYITNAYNIKKYFHHHIHEESYLLERMNEINKRTYPREELSRYLTSFLEPFHPSEKTKENIQALGKEGTFVVVAGQQAGLLTGPLYTIHKIISIIQLAKKYEEQLQVKVVPVFWVAGEDHDIEEINHIHVLKNKRVKKGKLYSNEKKIATETTLDKEQCQKWLNDIIATYGETVHTREVQHLLKNSLQASTTYVDFFIHLILHLFKETGLVVMDSGDAELRKIEAPFFHQMIKNNQEIMSGLKTQQELLVKDGFTPQIQVKEQCAHLFYHVDGERMLLERNEEHHFVTKDGTIKISYEELLHIAEVSPEKLSNNVVTRPLMQECLFPNLAFVAGPGELAYWGELKRVFEVMKMDMPPVLPRQMITLVERHIEQDINDVSLTIEDVLKGSSMKIHEQNWFSQKALYPVAEEFSAAQQEIKVIHERLQGLVVKVEANLAELSMKNEGKILEQLSFLEKKVEMSMREKHYVDLMKFGRIEHSIRPLDGYQERIWNIFYYVNQYGIEIVDDLLQTNLQWDMKHKVVFI